jgi:hypothetical protein
MEEKRDVDKRKGRWPVDLDFEGGKVSSGVPRHDAPLLTFPSFELIF